MLVRRYGLAPAYQSITAASCISNTTCRCYDHGSIGLWRRRSSGEWVLWPQSGDMRWANARQSAVTVEHFLHAWQHVPDTVSQLYVLVYNELSLATGFRGLSAPS